MDQKRQANPKLVKALTALLFIAVGAFIARSCFSSDAATSSADKFIPNLDSGEITAQLEKAGYQVERRHGSDGTTWSMKATGPASVTRVDYYSSEIGKVEGLSAGFTVFNRELTDIAAGHNFLRSFATMPFAGAERDSVAAWFTTHYHIMGEHVDTVGVVEVGLIATTEHMRSLRLRKL